MFKKKYFFLSFLLGLLFPQTAFPAEAPSAPLSLTQAIQLALEKNPDLLAFNQTLSVGEGLKLQAGVKPNPEFAMELEGEDPSFLISQTLERSGKRKARVGVSQSFLEKARLEYAQMRQEIVCEVYEHFVGLLISKKLLALAEESRTLSLEVQAQAIQRVQAGVGSKADEARARLNVFSAELAERQAKRDFEKARLQLYALWNEDPDTTEIRDTDFEHPYGTQFFESWKERTDDAPEMQAQEAELQISKTELESARQEAKTEFTLSAGVKQVQESEDSEILVGFSKPLGLFDRNQGKIQASEAAIKKEELEQIRVRRSLRLNLSLLTQETQGLEDQIQALREKLIPEAKLAFQSLEEAYRQGRLSFLEVLNAQEALFDLRKQYWSALQNYHQQASEWMKKSGVSPEEAIKQGILS